MLIAIAVKDTGRNPDWRDGKKKKNLIVSVSMTDDNSDREVQVIGDEDVMYEPLIDDIGVKMLMEEADFEVETDSRDKLQGV